MSEAASPIDPHMLQRSIRLSIGYVLLAMLFGLGLWHWKGLDIALQYWTGYCIEKSLAVDNLFVIAWIFKELEIPSHAQNRVLWWGILGALVFRAILIGFSAVLVTRFQWMLAFFGVFLLLLGYKMLRDQGRAPTPLKEQALYRLCVRHLPITDTLHGEAFWVRGPKPGLGPGLWMTRLFLALILVELMDLVFALDSIPAIFAITQDPFIVYSANVFAILGLRALYGCLSYCLDRFHYLHTALGGILSFVGVKILCAYAHGQGWIGWHIPTHWSLGAVLGLLLGGVVASYLYPKSAGTARGQ